MDEQTWTFKTLPKIGEEINKDNFHNLKTIIDKCLNDDKYEQGRKEAIKESWYNIGNSARDIFLYMREKHKEVSGS